MAKESSIHFDAVVVGGGIAGLQAALDLADQDYRVAVIEKDASIGGKMIRLSKVFPTLDCASCITTPKMASAAHHENITLFTYCDLISLNRKNGKLRAWVRQNPRYVDPVKCIGCRQCELNCPVYVSDEEQGGFTARKAISIPFSNAIPQIAVHDPEHCTLCGKCIKVCPTDAVVLDQRPHEILIDAETAVLSTGYEMTPANQKPEYGAGGIPNVVTSLQMERLLAPHGPYNRVLRPADGKEPDSIAYIQCAGSRDKTLGIPYCSRVCCMYAVKQAMLLSGALPLADITIYYMDIRAFGKGYEQFYQNAKAMGIEFVKGKAATLSPASDHRVTVRYEALEEGGGVLERDHDLVVLSLGMVPAWQPGDVCPVGTDGDAFLKCRFPKSAPSVTDTEGVFTAGCASGPKDIVDTIVEAGAAALEASAYIAAKRKAARSAA